MLIDKLLAGAVRLWLQSQISAIENLKVKISGKDRQILQGYIPEVFLSATHGIYQGINFSELTIKGTNIKFNLPQIRQKEPLQLLEPIVVELKVLFLAVDLQNSLSSPLLTAGLTDLWSRFLLPNALTSEGGQPQAPPMTEGEPTTSNQKKYDCQWHHLSLSKGGICSTGDYIRVDRDNSSIGIKTNLKLKDTQTLLLSPQEIITVPELPLATNEPLAIDLGDRVTITKLEITADNLRLEGTITVFP